MPAISVVIIAKNEEKRIRPCLDSLKSFAAEIVVVDSGSEDRTMDLCRELGCRVLSRQFDGYGSQKQFAVDQAMNDWVLSIDADEVLTKELQEEISVLSEQKDLPFDAYKIPFYLVYLGRVMKHSGVGNEMHLRLFNRKKGRFTTSPVHEGIVTEGSTGKLKHRVLHYSYRDISHHLEKINIYTTRAAEGLLAKGKRYSSFSVAVKFPLSFVTYYFVKGGILDGYPGFMWSWLAAFHSALKIAKTIELQTRQ
jgi:glycosyltransferase involved in cell wall biosynthesis